MVPVFRTHIDHCCKSGHCCTVTTTVSFLAAVKIFEMAPYPLVASTTMVPIKLCSVAVVAASSAVGVHAGVNGFKYSGLECLCDCSRRLDGCWDGDGGRAGLGFNDGCAIDDGGEEGLNYSDLDGDAVDLGHSLAWVGSGDGKGLCSRVDGFSDGLGEEASYPRCIIISIYLSGAPSG